MKKIKLDARKLQLKKETIAQLTKDQMGNVLGGQPVTTATKTTCCLPTTATGGYCPPPTTANNTCNASAFNQCGGLSAQLCSGADNCYTGYDPTDCSDSVQSACPSQLGDC